MESQDLKHRSTTATAIDSGGSSKKKGKRDNRRISMAKRGLRSLAVAISIPVSLTLLAIYLGSGEGYHTSSATVPFWFPPIWALYSTCVASSFLMGLAAWLVWAESGFHRRPTALYLYWAQLSLSLIWDLVLFGAGSSWAGLMFCAAMLGALVGCYQVFKEVNPIASEVLKPCLAWTAFLTLVNFRLVFL
ncbi:TspO/MBR-related protein [Parasponia andersonii]|uniref:TspO/MBR-related protein n=1 Tax=Parasponia andersonii TaxID=3476 RepID=A0A2P5DYY4_PARAD|nr:TspO/MBR-related protein [Parasponia andersonii]